MSFFFIPPPKGLKYLGEVNLPCGKTLVRRKCAAGQKAALPVLLLPSQLLKISILTAPCKKDTTYVVSFFFPSGDSEPRWPLVEAQVMSQARQIGENQGQFLGLSNFLWYDILP